MLIEKPKILFLPRLTVIDGESLSYFQPVLVFPHMAKFKYIYQQAHEFSCEMKILFAPEDLNHRTYIE